MKNTMTIAIETYSKLSNRTFNDIVNECNNGNEVIIESIKMLMFSAA